MIALSVKEQWLLNASDLLEADGFHLAAAHLRAKVTALAPFWRAEEEARSGLHVAPTDLFRVHHGSLPPQPPHSTATPAVVEPSIRPDQTTA